MDANRFSSLQWAVSSTKKIGEILFALEMASNRSLQKRKKKQESIWAFGQTRKFLRIINLCMKNMATQTFLQMLSKFVWMYTSLYEMRVWTSRRYVNRYVPIYPLHLKFHIHTMSYIHRFHTSENHSYLTKDTNTSFFVQCSKSKHSICTNFKSISILVLEHLNLMCKLILRNIFIIITSVFPTYESKLLTILQGMISLF